MREQLTRAAHHGPCPAGGHHHEHSKRQPAPHDEHDCPVCLAVSAPVGDGLPAALVLHALPASGFIRWMGSQRIAVLWVGRDRASRGPPRTA